MTKITKFKIGICQLKVTKEKNSNIFQARNLIHAAAEQGANLILLPEMWNCPYSADLFAEFAENLNDINSSPWSLMLSEVAYSLGVTIIGGSTPERDASSGRLYNTCCVFGPNGELKAKPRKIHLLDIGKPLPGDVHFKESDSFSAGEESTVVETDFGCIGIGICHDLRFPELAILYKARGAHLICYPGAFNMSTGEALWELEQRARAVDNQMGEIIGTTGHGETVLIAEIDYAKIQLTRDSFPLENRRRDYIYRFIDLHQESL